MEHITVYKTAFDTLRRSHTAKLELSTHATAAELTPRCALTVALTQWR